MKWRGSYTVEAAVIIPVLIWTMAAAMCTGIDLLHEVREEHEEKQIEDMWAVDSFYQYQTLKEEKIAGTSCGGKGIYGWGGTVLV